MRNLRTFVCMYVCVRVRVFRFSVLMKNMRMILRCLSTNCKQQYLNLSLILEVKTDE